MPPVLGPSSPSKIRLKSWAGCIGTTVVPSQKANSETSGPSRYSSTTTSPAASPRARAAAARSVVTMTPLPAARPSSLTTYGGPNASRAAATSSAPCAQPGGRGRHAGGRHHVLGEGLRALEPGGLARRPEAGDARGGDGVGDAGDERRLGADDHQVGAEIDGQRGHGLAGHRVDVVQGRDGRDAGVARGGVHLVDIRVAGQGEGQGVLAPAGTDDERLHAEPHAGRV